MFGTRTHLNKAIKERNNDSDELNFAEHQQTKSELVRVFSKVNEKNETKPVNKSDNIIEFPSKNGEEELSIEEQIKKEELEIENKLNLECKEKIDELKKTSETWHTGSKEDDKQKLNERIEMLKDAYADLKASRKAFLKVKYNVEPK